MVKKYKYKKSIVFNYDSTEHFFFQIINIGEKDEDNIKFIFSNPEGGTGIIYMDEGLKMDKDSILTSYGELTYHKDGSLMHKFPIYPIQSKKHVNPESIGYRRTPISKIEEWESIFTYNIYDYNLCRLRNELLTEQKYNVGNFDVITNGLPFYSIVSFIRDSFKLPNPRNTRVEKNIVIKNVGENLHLWIFLSLAKENGYWIEMDEGSKKVFSKNNQLTLVERK